MVDHNEVRRLKRAMLKNERRYRALKPCCSTHNASPNEADRAHCWAERAGRLGHRLDHIVGANR